MQISPSQVVLGATFWILLSMYSLPSKLSPEGSRVRKWFLCHFVVFAILISLAAPKDDALNDTQIDFGYNNQSSNLSGSEVTFVSQPVSSNLTETSVKVSSRTSTLKVVIIVLSIVLVIALFAASYYYWSYKMQRNVAFVGKATQSSKKALAAHSLGNKRISPFQIKAKARVNVKAQRNMQSTPHTGASKLAQVKKVVNNSLKKAAKVKKVKDRKKDSFDKICREMKISSLSRKSSTTPGSLTIKAN